MDWKLALQLAGVVLGLLYLWLEYRADIRLWIVGLVMPLVHGALYYKSGLYADCAMQVYYILAGLYGLCVWAKKPKPAERETGRIGNHVTYFLQIEVLLSEIIFYSLYAFGTSKRTSTAKKLYRCTGSIIALIELSFNWFRSQLSTYNSLS